MLSDRQCGFKPPVATVCFSCVFLMVKSMNKITSISITDKLQSEAKTGVLKIFALKNLVFLKSKSQISKILFVKYSTCLFLQTHTKYNRTFIFKEKYLASSREKDHLTKVQDITLQIPENFQQTIFKNFQNFKATHVVPGSSVSEIAYSSRSNCFCIR